MIDIGKIYCIAKYEILKFNCQLHPASGEVSRVSAEKVLAAAVAKSEELGVKVFFRLEITTNRYFCFVFTTLRLYMDTIHSFYQKIFY